jgi:hypothetical protein
MKPTRPRAARTWKAWTYLDAGGFPVYSYDKRPAVKTWASSWNARGEEVIPVLITEVLPPARRAAKARKK